MALTRLHSPADAEDAVQEVFVRLLTARPSFRDEGREKAWLIRATLNRASDMRRAASYSQVPLEEAALTTREEPAQLLSAVQALPGNYSAVIHLFYYEGYSIKEIAQILRLPVSTVGTRLARGRERLRQMPKEDVQ